MQKKVSVIINCYNGEKYLKECVKSILRQNYQNIEIIFFDNCSTDNSKKIINEFGDNRIKYFFSPKKIPLYQARNEAIKNSTGELIAFLDVDDIWLDNFLLSRSNDFLNAKYDYFYSNTYLLFEKRNKIKIYRNNYLPSGKIYDYLVKDYFIIISGLVVKKEIFNKFGMFNQNYNIIGDYDFIMRISKLCYGLCNNSPLIYYRIHQNNFLKKNSKLFYEEYKDWYNNNLKENHTNFINNLEYFKNKLSYLEITYLLIEKKKKFKILKKILSHKIFFERVKLLILFLLPKFMLKYLKGI